MSPAPYRRLTFALLVVVYGVSFWRPGSAADIQPIFRLEASGPTSYVTGMEFSPDGRTLYVGGFDKVVRVWKLNDRTGQFELDDRAAFRVPIGPGQSGAVNAIAVSPDGNWLAVGGRGAVVGEAGFRDRGRVVPIEAISDRMRLDLGTIYVFNTQNREMKTLRGHLGEILSMTFAPSGEGFPYLVSVGAETGVGRDQSKLIAWDLANEKPAAEQVMPWQAAGNKLGLRPRLAGWRSANGSVAAVAWGPKVQRDKQVGGGFLAVWPFEQGLAPQEIPGRFEASNTIAYYGATPNSQLFLAADDFLKNNQFGWRLNWFEVVAGQPQSNPFEHQFGPTPVPRRPRELASVSSGGLNLAAVIIGEVNQGQFSRHELLLIGLDNPVKTLAKVDLGNPADFRRAPVLATSAKGKHVAVGGFGDQEVQVFQIDDLLRGQAKPQLLRSVGRSVAEVGFARNSENNALGLVFRRSSDAKARRMSQGLTANDLVFDLNQRRFQNHNADSDWKMANAGDGPFRYSVSGRQLLISENGRVVSRIDPPPSDRPIHVAIGTQTKPPMVALAAHLNGEALIWLYDARTGHAFRQLNAHTLPVESLAFSDDGTLLASAGEDQFSCVWDLTTIDEVIGKRGTLDGVALSGTANRVTVDEIRATGLPLRVGDRLLGVVEDGEVTDPWTDPLSVYDSFWPVSPGETLAVRVSRGDGAQIDVRLPASQALDEQKPLFSMFLFRDDLQNDASMRRWIGWNPSGYYDASDEQAEQTLGWHFNRQGGTPPTSFARADRYRKEYRYPGLLPYLIENRQPPLMAFRPALPMPVMDFVFPGDLQLATSEGTPTRVRHRQMRLHVRRYPAAEIRSIELRINGEKKGNFKMMPDASWLADIDEDAWARGVQNFQAFLHGKDKQYGDSLSIRYVPPAPTIAISDRIEKSTDREQLSFDATVTPGIDGQPTSYWLVHQHAGGVVTSERQTIHEVTKFTRSVKLLPGLNRIEVHATNDGAVDGQRSLESAHRSVQTTYMKPTPLSLAVREVVSESGALQTIPLEFLAGIPLVVERPQMHLSLDFQAGRQSKIVRQIGNTAIPIPISEFRPNVSIQITDTVNLQRGIQTVSYEASNDAGEKSQTALTFDFRPPLPSVARVIQPPPRSSFVAGRNVPVDFESTPIRVQLEGYDPENKPDIEVIRNGSVVNAPASIRDDGLLSVEMPVVTGGNDVRIRLKSEWRPGEQVIAAVNFELSRPPIILPIDPPVIEDSPFVELIFNVASYSRPRMITINGNAVPQKQISQVAGTETWRVATQRGLEPGKNRFVFKAWNVDGESLDPGQLELAYVPPPEPEPVAVISLNPQSDVKTTESEFEVHLSVTSKSPLTGVHVFHNQKLIETFQQNQSGRGDNYVVDRTVTVSLTPELNLIEVRAANGGGEVDATLRVSRVDPPVQIVITKLSSRPSDGQVQEILPTSREGSSVRFEEAAAHWNPVLHGYVKWSSDSPDLSAQRRAVQVWVNGFQQLPGQLDPAEGEERIRRFSLPIMLNQSSENRISVKLPDLKDDDASAVDLLVDSNHPQLEQRLHVVIVGVGVRPQEETTLLDQFAEAMEVPADAWQGRSFETDKGAFAEGRVYNVWTGEDLDDSNVFGSLHRIGESIRQLNREEQKNDVVMLYYQGGELVEQPEEFFLTMRRVENEVLTPATLRRRHLSSLDLTRVIKRMQGAQVLLLDVARTPNASKMPYAKLAGFEQAAVLRYAWLQLPQRIKSQLLIAMSAATPTKLSLGELRDQVQGQALSVESKFPNNLLFEHHVPESLRNLLVIRDPAR